MFAQSLFTRPLFVALLSCAAPAWGQSQRDQVCQGSCGGGCGPCASTGGGNSGSRSYSAPPPSAEEIAARQATALNDQGVDASNAKNYAAAERYFTQALALKPNDAVVIKNLAYTRGHEGEDAYKNGDYAAALQFFQEALPNVQEGDRNYAIIRDDLAATKGKIEEAKRAQEQRQQDKIAASNMQQSIQQYAQTLNAAPASGGLEFGDGSSPGKPDHSGGLAFMDSKSQLKDAVADSSSDQDVTSGAFGTKVAKPKLMPASRAAGPRSDGPRSDSKAGDQLVSAAATAAEGGSLTKNYDSGDARYAGSLGRPTVDGKDHSIDPATFSPRVKNDPRMIAALEKLSILQDKRSQMDSELKQMIRERNAATDPDRMRELTSKVDQKNNEYQSNLKALSDEEVVVKKTKRRIETKEEPFTAPAK